ncbi:MBL fold metallo-hydrolase [Roseomonas eburnea]|uniref:MBL fold metallo-hydrolase n=1 Tax=Neoroseomonas eburnea TaxID=1346889 RepID=A0A9X9XCG6_9PROT|nr:MBL fold metallo-hydrolase [Neoroseomonas eburnea]MBR0681402.1 MBL fold metallo-hydrolase [Neoroseomonas eburnea]
MATPPTEQVPAIHHRRVGDIVLTVVSDGFLDGSMSVLQNISPEEASEMLRAVFRPVPRRTSLNCFLVHSGGRTALIDTGAGTHMQKSSGQLPRNLAATGVSPAEIDTVLLTHMHPDHSNGLGNAEGAAAFPQAELAMHAAEHAYWTDAEAEAEVARSGQGVPTGGAYFPMARRQMAPYAERLRLFQGGQEVFPGVTAMHFPGHTPGHCGYLIASGGESLLIWGDIVHLPEVQVPRPEVTIQFDVDPAQAAATRRRVFDMVATERTHIAGMHLHFPATAHLAREGAGYRLFPEAWTQVL